MLIRTETNLTHVLKESSKLIPNTPGLELY